MPGTPDALPNIYGLDARALAELPPLAAQPAFRSRQIADWLYVHGATAFSEMTNLPKDLRRRLEESCRIDRGRLVETTATPDGSALKALVGLEDGRALEAVWIRDDGRETLCISSQVGCAYGCDFCATAAMRAGRDLTPGEILGQIAGMRAEMARRDVTDLHNIVFMGMGEPLANYSAVTAALRLICGEPGFGIAARRVTISTVGLAPEIVHLAHEPLPVRLAFSLNATTDEVRNKLMPVNRKYPFRKVFEALREFQRLKKSRVTLGYVLLKGINDTSEDARRLAGFARSLQCRVNLISYNPHPFSAYEPVDDEGVEAFRRLMAPIARHVVVTVRWSKGAEIQAACGQLAAGSTDGSPAADGSTVDGSTAGGPTAGHQGNTPEEAPGDS
jgi:23S rRNA (adenine2503-C2)-methyltransferase